MKNYRIFLIISALSLSFATGYSYAQDEETSIDIFQRNLLDSFIGPLQADGVAVTGDQRAMFMGYLLNRQSQYNGHYESDRIRLQQLTDKVREFVTAVSPDKDLWPIVEAGMAGKYKELVNSMLGGSPYVKPMFQSLGDIADKCRELEYSSGVYSEHPDRDAILKTALDYLRLLKDGRYKESLELAAGRYYEEFSDALQEFESSPEKKARADEFLRMLEWKAGLIEMSSTEPPVTRILFTLAGSDGNWKDEYCFLILDNGTWKIVRFID